MPKRLRTGKGKVHSTTKSVVMEPRTAAAIQGARRADPSLLDPYDWGPEGVPKGKPLHYVPGKGFVLED